MPAESFETSPLAHTCCPVVELRQYTLYPGMRDTLIELFDREFVETQEAVGMKVIGQFRDLDDPDRFVWLRGFNDMPARAEGLAAFYGGPVWKTHRNAANATMIDSDNVMLLRPARPAVGFSLENSQRPAPGAQQFPDAVMIATVYYLNAAAELGFVDFFEQSVQPILIESGASILTSFITEPSENNFPALPVRPGEHVFIWFARFNDLAAYEQYSATLAQFPTWRDTVLAEVTSHLKRAPEVLKLSPTSRSQLLS